jgi:predicted nucleotidyltransferase
MNAYLTAEQLRLYRASAQHRRQRKAQCLTARHERAWRVVQQATQVLKADFGARDVMVFGSMLLPNRFHQHSDVDLAVWDLPEQAYYQAVGRLQGLDPDIAVDVIAMEDASPTLQATIRQTGYRI